MFFTNTRFFYKNNIV